MDAAHEAHVEAEQDDALDAELDRQVKRMESTIATPADLPRPGKQELIDAWPTHDAMDVGEALGRAAVLGDLEPSESGHPVECSPPSPVARIERVRPGDYLEGVIDGEDAEGRVPRLVEVDFFEAGPSADDDGGATSPVWEPFWGPATCFGGAGVSSVALMRVRARWRVLRAVGPAVPCMLAWVIVSPKGRAPGAALASSFPSGPTIFDWASAW